MSINKFNVYRFVYPALREPGSGKNKIRIRKPDIHKVIEYGINWLYN